MPNGNKAKPTDLEKNFERAARALCKQRDGFLDAVRIQRGWLQGMQRYINDLPGFVDLAAMKPEKGTRPASKQLTDREDYDASSVIVSKFKIFLGGRDEELLHDLRKYEKHVFNMRDELSAANPFADKPFGRRVRDLPINKESVALMKQVASKYKDAIPGVTQKGDEAFGDLIKESRRLPLPFREFENKRVSYYLEREFILTDKTLDARATEKAIKLLTLNTFKSLRNRYSPFIVPKPPTPTQG